VYAEETYTHMKASDKLLRQGVFIQLLWITLITSLPITLLELAKHLLFRDLNNWQYQIGTITINSFIASTVLFLIIKKYAGKTGQLEKEINQRKHMETALNKSEEKFKQLIEQAPLPIAVCDHSNNVLHLNEKFTETFGYTQKDISTVCDWYTLVYPDEAYRKKIMDSCLEAVHKLTREGVKIRRHETTVTCKDGTTRDIEIKMAPIIDLNMVIFNDMTERNKFEKLLFQGKKEWEGTFDIIDDAITIHDRNLTVTRANKAAEKMFGLPFSMIIGKKCYELCHGAGSLPRNCTCSNVLKTGKPSTAEMFEPHLNKFIQIKAFPFFDNNKQVSKLVHVVTDITHHKKIEEKLRSFAITDELTGLYNLRGFNTLAIQQLTIAKRQKKGMFLISADLDKLKEINDTHGHVEGDRALIEFANILKDSFRESDLIARIGGDEFVVLQIEDTATTPEVVTSRLFRNVELCNLKGEFAYKLSISIGVAHCLRDTDYTINNLLIKADKLMYEHKALKRHL
jgi:diguanylate cyclase (GGDEF)-like protein/PAS domain S-box-containing protein